MDPAPARDTAARTATGLGATLVLACAFLPTSRVAPDLSVPIHQAMWALGMLCDALGGPAGATVAANPAAWLLRSLGLLPPYLFVLLPLLRVLARPERRPGAVRGLGGLTLGFLFVAWAATVGGLLLDRGPVVAGTPLARFFTGLACVESLGLPALAVVAWMRRPPPMRALLGGQQVLALHYLLWAEAPLLARIGAAGAGAGGTAAALSGAVPFVCLGWLLLLVGGALEGRRA
ncbi:MAG: hypothetical protein HZA54_16180 [Planctomycetes bacterium]|nr:hypothetical protein [Planctomycetota bacterium]